MATLNKILIHVPSELCDGFKSKYVTATNRSTIYDNKVVFLEKTQEIFTQGKLYGTTFKDFNDLKTLVGTLPSDATSKNLVDYINKVKTDLIGKSSNSATENTIYGAKKYADNAASNIVPKFPIVAAGTGITVDASGDGIKTTYTISNSIGAGLDTTASSGVALAKNTNGTIKVNVIQGSVESGNSSVVTGGTVYSYIKSIEGSKTSTNGSFVNVRVNTSGGLVSEVAVTENDTLKSAVPLANSAMQSVSILGKALDKTTKSITVAEAKTFLGLKSAAYAETSAFDAAGAAANVKSELIGKGTDTSSYNTIYGARKYTDVAVSNIVGNGPDLASADTIHGAKNYAFETAKAVEDKLPGVFGGNGITVSETPDENGKITYTISNSAVTGVVQTSSSGVALVKNPNGTIKVKVTPGSVASGNTSVVTGGIVYNAIAAAEGRCDAKGTAQNLINNLSYKTVVSNSAYINSYVTSYRGQVTNISVTPGETLNIACSYALNSIQNIKAAYNSTSAASLYLTVSYANSGNYKTVYIDLNIEKVVQAVRDRLGI